MIAGLLPALARDLNVGLPAAGHLVTAFSLAYAIGAPVMAVLTAGLDRVACWPLPWAASPWPTCSPRWRRAVGRAAAAGAVRSELHAGGQRICRPMMPLSK